MRHGGGRGRRDAERDGQVGRVHRRARHHLLLLRRHRGERQVLLAPLPHGRMVSESG